MRSIDQVALLFARLLLAALYLPDSVQKLTHFAASSGVLAKAGLPAPDLFATLAIFCEIAGPLALIVGFMPRATALLMIAFTIAATLVAHRFWEAPSDQASAQAANFLKNTAIIGGFLLYFVHGPGRFAWVGYKTSVKKRR